MIQLFNIHAIFLTILKTPYNRPFKNSPSMISLIFCILLNRKSNYSIIRIPITCLMRDTLIVMVLVSSLMQVSSLSLQLFITFINTMMWVIHY